MPMMMGANVFGYKTTTAELGVPSIWDVVQQNLGSMVSQAVDQAQAALSSGDQEVGGLRQQLTNLLHSSLDKVAAWHSNMGPETPSVNDEIDGAVSGAVDKALDGLNITVSAGNLSDFREQVVKILDREIEIDVFNKVIANASRTPPGENEDFFHSLSFKDETLFVILLCMGIVLPIIIITLSLIYFMKRKRENIERSQEMLLQNQAEFSMDEYTSEQADGRNGRNDEVPDLVLKDFTV
ncbi:hypothetical protein ElyMa_006224700 [Elysia marginata]|uniref:Uncharacterized protein n=1 Tax=Elysia marginata TaxID=1093978 RepID=A0AAV4H9E6_9GAST|nr:hypothetical protein ElyMa_006224700 [Elysia marginata]